jgi:hypothetical protein
MTTHELAEKLVKIARRKLNGGEYTTDQNLKAEDFEPALAELFKDLGVVHQHKWKPLSSDAESSDVCECGAEKTIYGNVYEPTLKSRQARITQLEATVRWLLKRARHGPKAPDCTEEVREVIEGLDAMDVKKEIAAGADLLAERDLLEKDLSEVKSGLAALTTDPPLEDNQASAKDMVEIVRNRLADLEAECHRLVKVERERDQARRACAEKDEALRQAAEHIIQICESDYRAGQSPNPHERFACGCIS